ncbi:unnamed protein product [Oreochromis niloticus]|nr:unnamed protein product [Mustela putorius furo]
MALQEISVIFTHRPSAFSAAVLLLTLVLCRESKPEKTETIQQTGNVQTPDLSEDTKEAGISLSARLAIIGAVFICISLISWGFMLYQNCKEPIASRKTRKLMRKKLSAGETSSSDL